MTGQRAGRDEPNEPAVSGRGVEVRRLTTPTRTEIERLAEIFDVYRVHYGEAADAPQAASWLEGNISSGGVEAFVAEENDRFVGFAITMAVPASLRLGHFWQIRDLFVLPSHRRLGIGRRLLDSIRAAAIATGALRVVLQTEADNTAALRLYAENGYSAVEGYCSLMLSLSSRASFESPAGRLPARELSQPGKPLDG
jgi:ribosomal protein S18 acetylase RimI-like enzyme